MKIYHIKIRAIIVVLIGVFFAACEEVIEIDLNSSNPVLVAEGVIDNGLPAWIKLSYTSDYFDAEKANIEQEATVIISDNTGATETLKYVSNGLYQGKDLIGDVDKQYKITIFKNGVEYEASSKLYPPSEILSVSFEENDNRKPGHSTSYNITINFKDDPSYRNYYLIKYQTSGEVEDDAGKYYMVDDYGYDNTGKIEFSPMQSSFGLDDEVTIELYSIDEDSYLYYSEMNNASGGMMGGSSTPYTPKSNFGNEVLGYFVAWSKVEWTTTVQ